ncbi:MAG TPA: steroid 3-ketoacyl-CoA thiolase [Acidimicrobiales bacterium]|nr:steroid 3-ketoacyl-CoA thiolase [Acidimicrobiales bacterium]
MVQRARALGGLDRCPVIVDAVRTPFGRRGGVLSGWHPVDLAAFVIGEVVQLNGIDPVAVDDVVLGCASQVGAQAGNLARRAALAAGWPVSVPGATVDRHAASSAQAVHWAAHAAASGAQDLVVAGGVEMASVVPLGAPLAQPATGKPFGTRLVERFKAGGGLLPPGLVAEELARRWELSRERLDNWAVCSTERAVLAQRSRPAHILPTPLPAKSPSGAAAGTGPAGKAGARRAAGTDLAAAPRAGAARGRRAAPGLLTRDEALAKPATAENLRRLRPMFQEGGLVTAGNMAAEGDGCAAVVVASEAAALVRGLQPRARFVSFASAGGAPDVWPMAAAAASQAALARAGVRAVDVDAWFVHESSAAAVLAWSREVRAPLDLVNPDGGALGTGSPVGAAGAAMFASAVGALAAGAARLALVAAAGEGGVGTACLLGCYE